MILFGERQPGLSYVVRPAAYAVIFDADGRVACVAEESGLYLPGGGIDPGEDALAAVHREVAEECGCALEIIRPLPGAVQFFISKRDEPFEVHAAFFAGRLGPRLDAPAQHETHWFPIEPLPPLHHASHRWAVTQALAG